VNPFDIPASLGADQPIDDLDTAVLGEIRRFWAAADPLPAGLVDQIRFAVDLESYDLDVLPISLLETASAARGEEMSRLITFSGDTMTIMIRTLPGKDGTNRIDGWLSPGDRHPIEMRAGAVTVAAVSDATGRFVFPSVPIGLVQLVIRPTGTTRTVITPAVLL
jgi:hypothetical protein